MPTWNGVPIPNSPQIKIPNSIPQNFNWNSYVADPKGTFNKFKGAREAYRLNWKGYRTATTSIRKIVVSSPSRKFISAAGKQIRGTKQAADTARKVQEAFYKKMPGGGTPKNAGIAGGSLLSIVLQGGLAVAVIQNTLIQNFINDRVDNQFNVLNNDLSKNLTLLTTLNSRIKNLDAKVSNFNERISRELDANAKDYARLNKQAEVIAKNAVDAKKQANDALYETRESRRITESKVVEANRKSNDALYEARTTKQNIEIRISGVRETLEAKIQQVNSQISKFNNSANEAFQKAITTTVSKVQSDLAATKAQVSAIRQTPVNTSEINANAVAAAKAIIIPLQSAIGSLSNQTNAAVTLAGTAINGVSNLAQAVSTANNTASIAQQEAQSTRNYVDRILAPRIQVTITQNEGIRVTAQNAQQEAQSTRNYVDKVLVPRVEATITESTGVKAEITEIKQEIPTLTNEIRQSQTRIAEVDKKLTEQAKVNEQALPKLDQIVGILGLIPARSAAAIRPDIPTIPQIETAAATGTCRTTQPGGCISKALADNAANIANNNNANSANILSAVNTGANAAQLALLQTIDNKIGAQLPGGLSGTFGRLWQTLQVDRILNVLILITTFHNALMLSNNIAETLFGAVDNISQAVGFKWKNEKGEEEGFGEIVKEWTSDFFKSIFGVANYNNLVAAYKRANRIYQAGANIINATRSMVDSLRNITEYCAEGIGKVGNALKKAGTIASDAFNWMPENVDGRSIWIRRLENINEVAEGLEMVTGEVLGITQNINEIREQTDEFNRGIKDLPPKDRDNNQPVKAREDTATAASISVIIPESSERKPTS